MLLFETRFTPLFSILRIRGMGCKEDKATVTLLTGLYL
jgi:hypothetical protein